MDSDVDSSDFSLVLDSCDNPHVCYSSGNIMKYAYWDGEGWQIESITDNSNGWYSSLVLDENDNPHISYWGRDDSLWYTSRKQRVNNFEGLISKALDKMIKSLLIQLAS